jgi:signal transduction histidine kinase
MLYQLTRMTAEVERANEAKRHFVRYIFHEVRVPLNAVMLGLADLRSASGPSSADGASGRVEWTEEQREVLDIVHEQSQVVGRILNDVLSLHKIEDGALTLQFAPFSLESMILSTMQSFQPGIHEKQIHYTAQLQTVQTFVFSDRSVEELRALPQVDVIGDKYRLRQVLANFISNSIKVTTQHLPHLRRVSLSSPSDPSLSLHRLSLLCSLQFTPNLGDVHVSLQILPVSPVTHSHSLPPQNGAPSSASSVPAASHAIDIPASSTPRSSVPSSSASPSAGASSSVPWPSHAPTSAIFRIAVRDSGVGVSGENKKKLFSPYMQILPGELQKGSTQQPHSHSHSSITSQPLSGPRPCDSHASLLSSVSSHPHSTDWR